MSLDYERAGYHVLQRGHCPCRLGNTPEQRPDLTLPSYSSMGLVRRSGMVTGPWQLISSTRGSQV